MPRKTTKRDAAIIILGLIAFFVFYAISSFSSGDWRSGIGALACVLGFILWLTITQIPTTCGVRLKRNRGFCPNDITGLFFGCGSGKHTWTRPLALIGLGRKAPPVRHQQVVGDRNTQSSANAPAAAGETPNVNENGRNRILFWATIAATAMGGISTATDLIGIM
ncbi:hypothetical protein [Polymorphospora rubra]|uniref:Uncharacterized protein n=1 Tax=Polymorphospora rubra TaxID=338584 RepID=A0A810MWG8_9ACTN|nr:hypothetical protein [Polymorphospora rubra]BCJ63765.1 hypothetical protein Prubr_07860 [Polymorphospora rubra]